MFYQVPLPPSDTWKEFPVIGVIVLVFALIAIATFIFVRWIWKEYKVEQEKDRNWREQQDGKRETANAEQNKLWRNTIKEITDRWEASDRKRDECEQERDRMLVKITEAVTTMVHRLELHDERAERIEQVIIKNGQAEPKTPRVRNRGVT